MSSFRRSRYPLGIFIQKEFTGNLFTCLRIFNFTVFLSGTFNLVSDFSSLERRRLRLDASSYYLQAESAELRVSNSFKNEVLLITLRISPP